MLSLDLFDSKYERRLHEGAVDDAEYARLKKLGEKIDYLKQARAKTTDPEMRRAIDGRIKQYDDERHEILSVRGMKEAEQPQRAPAKGLLKGKDLVTPQQRVAGATPQKPGMAGAVKDVVGGIKRFVKGEPDQGPTFEQQQPLSPRALGVANFQRLVKANMGNVPTVNFEFIRPEENFKLDQRGLDLISDYYDGLESDQAKNYFIYRVLPSGDETLKVLKQLGWTPSQPVQQNLPGIPTQGELPLSEKKKSEAEPEFKAGDVKVARELQKLRALYPAARSDVEAVARAEIDSSERSQRQLAAIRGANEKQDALLKQLVALDKEQGREIDNLDQENNSLEKELAKIQATNDRLQQTIGQMTGTKKSAKAGPGTPKSIDLIPGAAADAQNKDEPQEPTPLPRTDRAPSQAMAAMAQQIQGLTRPAPTIRPAPGLKAANEPELDLQPKVSGSDIKEHGGGIGPRQHWQSMMRNEQALDRTGKPMYRAQEKFLVRHNGKDVAFFPDMEQAKAAAKDMMKDLKGFATVHRVMREGEMSKIDIMRQDLKVMSDIQFLRAHGMSKVAFQQKYKTLLKPAPAQDTPMEVKSMDEMFAAPGTTVPRKSVIQGYTVFFNPETKTVSVTRGGDSEEAAIEQQRISTVNLRTFRNTAERLIDKIESEDQLINEGIKDTASATAVIACLLTGGSLTGCATAPQQTTAQQVLKTGQDIGRTVQTAKKITRAGAEAEVNQEIRNLLRGVGGRPEELNNSNILRIWKRIKGQPPVTPEPQTPEYGPAEPVRRPATEAKEINTKDDFVKERDRLLRMINIETDPANRQILKSAIRQLEGRAENEGWISLQQRMIREDTAALAAEDAILKRIFVKHRDLMMEYGPDKITQAAESVAYNVGDIAHISDEQITEWVGQVESILGARP